MSFLGQGRLSCVDLFGIENCREWIQQNSPNDIMRKALKGDCVLNCIFTHLLTNEVREDVTWSEVVNCRVNLEDDNILSKFLVEGTDFFQQVEFFAMNSSHSNALILKALVWDCCSSQEKSLLHLHEWLPLVRQIHRWSSEHYPTLPLQDAGRNHHFWDKEEPHNQHSGLDQVKSGVGWFGRRCLECGAFLVLRRVGKKSWKEVLLGKESCPRSPYGEWLSEVVPTIEQKLAKKELFDISRGQLIMWGFLDK